MASEGRHDEINNGDQEHHESDVRKSDKVKCGNCEEIKKDVGKLKKDVDKIEDDLQEIKSNIEDVTEKLDTLCDGVKKNLKKTVKINDGLKEMCEFMMESHRDQKDMMKGLFENMSTASAGKHHGGEKGMKKTLGKMFDMGVDCLFDSD